MLIDMGQRDTMSPSRSILDLERSFNALKSESTEVEICLGKSSQSGPRPLLLLQFADFPDPMLYSDYLPELSRHLSCGDPGRPDLDADQVS